MSKIIRTKSRAEGGITPEEKKRMDEHVRLWTTRTMRTEPIEPSKITPAIKGIYAAAGLRKPRVVIVSSPLVMAFAYGASAAIWCQRKNGSATVATADATYAATADATAAATRVATYAATDDATDDATYAATATATVATADATYAATAAATRAATYAATFAATYDAVGNQEKMAAMACRDLAGSFGLSCAKRWWNNYQGGNMWASNASYITACRDILGLDLPEHKNYQSWEQAAIHGGFRVMHEEFCIVSDFPEILKIDDNNQPHCEDGPSHRWRDGWALYHWHGIRVPSHWIEGRENLNPNEVLKVENVEQRAAGCQIIGWDKMLDYLPHKILDSDPDPQHGDLIEVTLDGLPEPEWYLRFECPRNGMMMEGVNKRELSSPTVFAAQAWKSPLPDHLFNYPKTRS